MGKKNSGDKPKKSKSAMSAVRKANVIEECSACNIVEYPSIIGRANGSTASVSANIITSFLGKWALIGKLKKQIGLADLMSVTIEDEPLQNFTEFLEENTKQGISTCELQLDEFTASYLKSTPKLDHLNTISDFVSAYRAKTATPLSVVNDILAALENDDFKKINAVSELHKEEVVAAAQASTDRYNNGNTLSVLDGVPFFVKDEVAVEGYTIGFGDDIVTEKCVKTANLVKKLTDSGAILVGIANMSYLGYSTMGFNPAKRATTNPYNTDYYCGGSSSGSAAVIAANLAPFSIGVDGLGSNRIPPALTGVVGLKSTFGCFDNDGLPTPLKSYTQISFMSQTVSDSCLLYSLFNLNSNNSLMQLNNLSSLRVGYDDSFCKLGFDERTGETINQILGILTTKLNFTKVELNIPECKEMVGAMQTIILHDQGKSLMDGFGQKYISGIKCSNAKILCQLGLEINDSEYTQALKQRARAMQIAKSIFEKCDILLTPAVGCGPLKIEPGDETNGVLDDITSTRLTRFCVLASLTGIPAIVVPAGFDKESNLPIAVQLQSKWWNEKTLLEVAYFLEKELKIFQ